MIGFVIALENESKCIINDLENKNEYLLANKKVIEGKLYGKDVAIILSNVGKVNASFCTQLLIDKFGKNLEYIINYGISGSANKNLPLGSINLVTQWIQYDFDLSELEDAKVGKLNEFDTPIQSINNNKIDELKNKFTLVTLGTADRFSNSQKQLELMQQLHIDICDMEGSAIAQVCYYNNIPLVMLKGISDYVGDNLVGIYDKYYPICVQNIKDSIKNIL